MTGCEILHYSQLPRLCLYIGKNKVSDEGVKFSGTEEADVSENEVK